MMLSMPNITNAQIGLLVEAYIVSKLLEEKGLFRIPLKLDDPAKDSSLVEVIPIVLRDTLLIEEKRSFQLGTFWDLSRHDYLLYQRDERFPGFDFFIWSKTKQMLLAFQCTVMKENLVNKMNRNMKSFASVVHSFQEAFQKKGIDNLKFIPIALVPSWTEATTGGKNKDFFRVDIQDLQEVIPLADKLDENMMDRGDETRQDVGRTGRIEAALGPSYFTPKELEIATAVEQQDTAATRRATGTSEKVRHTTKRARRK